MKTSIDINELEAAIKSHRALQTTKAFNHHYLEKPECQYLSWYDDFDQHLAKNPLSMTLVHPGSGKSTRVGRQQCVRDICEDRTIRIGYFSRTQGKAALFMSAVGRELRFNQEIINDYGIFYDPHDPKVVWSNEIIRVVGSDPAKPTPTLINLGATSQVESLRLDRIIMDDPIDLNTALSPAETSRMDKLLGTLIDRLDAGGKLTIIGHRFLPDDFYQQVIDERTYIGTLVLPAFHEPNDITERLDYEDGGQPLAPEIWPGDSLIREKRDRHKTWEWEAWYMQERVSPADSTFSDIPTRKADSIPKRPHIVAVFDPAYSTSANADYSVCACGCTYKDGILLTDIQDWRISSAWASNFIPFAVNAGAKEAVVEINNAQTLGEELRAYVRANNLFLRVRDLRSRSNKAHRIGELADWAMAGTIYFYKGLEGKPAFQNLLKEWNLYPNIAHDDHLDALDMLRRQLATQPRAHIRRVKL